MSNYFLSQKRLPISEQPLHNLTLKKNYDFPSSFLDEQHFLSFLSEQDFFSSAEQDFLSFLDEQHSFFASFFSTCFGSCAVAAVETIKATTANVEINFFMLCDLFFLY